MRKLFLSEAFIVGNLICFVAMFLCQFVVVMSDNYDAELYAPYMKFIMWIMLINFVNLMISIGVAELDSRK